MKIIILVFLLLGLAITSRISMAERAQCSFDCSQRAEEEHIDYMACYHTCIDHVQQSLGVNIVTKNNVKATTPRVQKPSFKVSFNTKKGIKKAVSSLLGRASGKNIIALVNNFTKFIKKVGSK